MKKHKLGKILIGTGLFIIIAGGYILRKPEVVEKYKNKIRALFSKWTSFQGS